jgi:hypothetical protein
VAALDDGSVLISGGYGFGAGPVDLAWVYRPSGIGPGTRHHR